MKMNEVATEYIPQSLELLTRVEQKDLSHFSDGGLAINIGILDGKFYRLELGTLAKDFGFVLNPPLHTKYSDIPIGMSRLQIASTELDCLRKAGYDPYISLLVDRNSETPHHKSNQLSRFRMKKDESGELELYVLEN